jgi:hypothetical protein
LTGTDAGEFAVTGGTCASGTTTLAGGATCTVLVRFNPATAGAKAATLGVTATPGGTPTSSLTGTGS